MRQGEEVDHAGMNDIHYPVIGYGNAGSGSGSKAENLLKDMQKDVDGAFGVRRLEFFEVTASPENQEEVEKVLSAMHTPGYFERAFGSRIKRIQKLALSILPIDLFEPLEDTADIKTGDTYFYVLGKHDQRAELEPMDEMDEKPKKFDRLVRKSLELM